MSKTISVRLKDELYEVLEQAAATGVSKNKLVVEGLEMRLARKTSGTILRLRGLIAGPKDLSYGKEHRAAWGKARK